MNFTPQESATIVAGLKILSENYARAGAGPFRAKMHEVNALIARLQQPAPLSAREWRHANEYQILQSREWPNKFFAYTPEQADAFAEGYSAHCAAAQPAPAWVIADSGGTKFRAIDQAQVMWTTDRDAAIQFARRCDAESFAAEDEDAWGILPLAAQPSGEQCRKCGRPFATTMTDDGKPEGCTSTRCAYVPSGEQSGEELRKAATAFADKVDAITNSDEYRGIFTNAFAHGVQWRGPNFEAEYKTLRAALAASPAPAPTEERLREALRKYGWHLKDCTRANIIKGMLLNRKCTCGFAEAERLAGTERP